MHRMILVCLVALGVAACGEPPDETPGALDGQPVDQGELQPTGRFIAASPAQKLLLLLIGIDAGSSSPEPMAGTVAAKRGSSPDPMPGRQRDPCRVDDLACGEPARLR